MVWIGAPDADRFLLTCIYPLPGHVPGARLLAFQCAKGALREIPAMGILLKGQPGRGQSQEEAQTFEGLVLIIILKP